MSTSHKSHAREPLYQACKWSLSPSLSHPHLLSAATINIEKLVLRKLFFLFKIGWRAFSCFISLWRMCYIQNCRLNISWINLYLMEMVHFFWGVCRFRKLWESHRLNTSTSILVFSAKWIELTERNANDIKPSRYLPENCWVQLINVDPLGTVRQRCY